MVQVKTTETHGYNAVQVGYQVVPERKITKPQLNHLKKSGAPPMRKLKEYRVSTASTICSHEHAAAMMSSQQESVLVCHAAASWKSQVVDRI